MRPEGCGEIRAAFVAADSATITGSASWLPLLFPLASSAGAPLVSELAEFAEVADRALDSLDGDC